MKYPTREFKEIWKPILGYNGTYEASNKGRVKSFKYKSPRILKQTINNNGYYACSLCQSGKVKRMMVHRIICESFIENAENKETVNHKDGDKLNNNINNLEWATRKENIHHAIKLGLFSTNKFEVDKAEIETLYLQKNLTKRQIGAIYNVSRTTIRRILREYEIPNKNRSKYKKVNNLYKLRGLVKSNTPFKEMMKIYKCSKSQLYRDIQACQQLNKWSEAGK